ncbi:hypothetical protein [Acutalibacter sp. 1XD8-33]|uniref:hypothetical protein n=1 Tax=Acutalibacter sp. 1XD8-33 TaxID=2320081 RepID=UPI001314496A|nr:hypothetical protein [Acutalibacter sp. 1XD8-33]
MTHDEAQLSHFAIPGVMCLFLPVRGQEAARHIAVIHGVNQIRVLGVDSPNGPIHFDGD